MYGSSNFCRRPCLTRQFTLRVSHCLRRQVEEDRDIMNEETRIKWEEFETSSETFAKTTFSKLHFGRKGVGYLTEQYHT